MGVCWARRNRSEVRGKRARSTRSRRAFCAAALVIAALVPLESSVASETITYTYDARGRLVAVSHGSTGPNAGISASYSYDKADNRTNVTVTTPASACSGVSFSVNDASATEGNSVGFNISKGGSTTSSCTVSYSTSSASLKYNAFGERSIETIAGGGTHFIFSEDGTLLAEHTSTGTSVRNYIYLSGQPFALVDGAGTVSYVLNDQVGQPQKMLNGSGAVAWQRVAGIFGDTVSQPAGNTTANPLRFPGQWYSANAGGLHYNYFRDYDATTGRYIETDPMGLNGGLNPYVYVDGNPVVYIDRFGLCWYYSQSTHTLTHQNEQGKIDYSASNGYSGAAGPGKNNPAMQNVSKIGPIPQGTYTIGPAYRHPSKGPVVMNLDPAASNQMFGRDLFRIHGDSIKNPGHASEGCIIFPRDVRDMVNRSKDKCLTVVK